MTSPQLPAFEGRTSASKPRVLLVDDHPDLLKSLARLLSLDFEVVGAASDARQALDASHRLEPDIVVLDITMPGRDGFQTAHDLRESGSRAPIVFLTMHESDEFVAQGFRSGGRGYVLKTRVHSDLVNAMERVLAGQLFLPSLKSLFVIDAGATRHVVQFHPDEHAFVESVSSFLNVALRRGDAVSLVSTGPIRAGVARRLAAYGWSVGESGEHGRYRATDATEAVSSIMRNGRPNADRMQMLVAELERFRATNAEGPQSRLTVVGDLSAQLLLEGNLNAAMEVEHLWNDVTHALPFLTVCCYPMPSFSHDTSAHLLSQLCAEHYAVAHTPESGTRSMLT